jgi:hypothetical protein
MKKMCVFLVMAAVITGTVLAQNLPAPISITGEKFEFDAVLTTSTEARYSADIFSSYVDDFIGVNDYDPQTTTFLFLGGYGSTGKANDGIDDTEIITPAPYALSTGLATRIKSMYLGLYYAGNFVNANGWDNGKSGDNAATSAEATWKNNVAVLFGNLPLGAIRLDLIMDATDKTLTSDNKNITGTVGQGIITALTWGNNTGKLSPHFTLAFRFPDYGLTTSGKNNKDKSENYSNAVLGIAGGTGYDLNDTSSFSADVLIQGNFGKSTIGQTSYSEKGPFWTFVDLEYSKELALGSRAALGLKPKVAIAFKLYDPDVNNDGDTTNAPAETTFETQIGLDAGFKFKATNKFTLYTGATLNVFDWVAWGVSGGEKSAGGGSWKIDGMGWDTSAYGQNTLGVGLVFAPDEHLSVGCGLNALLDKLVEIDLQKMQVRAGGFWTSVNDQHFLGDWSGTYFDLTVSYKF